MRAWALSALISATLVTARVNDWSKPCFNGECAYDTLGTAETGYGSIKLWGSPKAITDITSAAGWVILDCDPNALVQDIRLVCKSDNYEEAGCDHIFNHEGPVNKVVRLPESCGQGPFARISNAQIASDQTIPAHAEKHISRRDGIVPQVHMLSIDMDFSAAPADAEPVNFILRGGNFPGLELDPDVLSGLNERDLDSFFKNLWGGIKKAATAVKDTVVKAATAVKNVAEKLTSINVDKSVSPPALDISKRLDLLNIHQQCGPFAADLKVTVDGKAHAQVKVGVVLQGSVIPPKIHKAGAYADLTAELDAHLMVHAFLHGEIDTGKKTLLSMGIPGFSIPGIFTLGPFLELQGRAKAQIDINLDIDVGVSYHVEGVEFWFPPSAGKNQQKSVKPKDTPVKLSASADMQAKGSIEGHIIPAIKLGLSVLLGKLKADVYLEADAFAKLELDAQLSASNHHRELDEVEKAYVPPYDHSKRDLVSYMHEHEPRGVSFTGCVDLKLGIALGGGAEANFFGLWKGDKEVIFFKKDWQVFKKCWAAGKVKRMSAVHETLPSRSLAKRGPICPKANSNVIPVTSETVKGSDIH